MGIKEDFDTALKLAKQGELTAARKLLLPHQGHERVDKLLKTINKKIIEEGISPPAKKPEKQPKRAWSDLSSQEKAQGVTLLVILLLCGLCSLWIIFLPDASDTVNTNSQAVASVVSTQPPFPGTDVTDNYPELENRINGMGEVNRVNALIIRSNADDEIIFYTEIMVDYGVDYRQVANDVLEWAVFELPSAEFVSFTALIDDRYTAVDYSFDVNALGWIVTPLESFNLTRAYLATDTPTPRPRPTSRPDNSNNQSQIQWSCTANRYNCEDLSCSEIRSYFTSCPGDPSNLDGDGDGIPCERQCN